jgi:CRP-like cAMP-binding protein
MHNGICDTAATLAGISLFEGLDPAVVGEIARTAHLIRLAKLGLAYTAGVEARAFFHVISGQLKVAVSSPDGGEKVIDIVGAGHSIGIAELFGNTPYVSFAEAVTPVTLLQIGRDAIIRAIDHDPRLSQRLLRVIAQRQSSIERDIAASSFQSGCRRVVDYLLCQAGPRLANGDTMVELGIPKHLLAARLGFTPETLSRAFRFLSEAGFISVRGKWVTLSAKLATAAANDEIEPAVNVPAVSRSRQSAGSRFDRPLRHAAATVAWF